VALRRSSLLAPAGPAAGPVSGEPGGGVRVTDLVRTFGKVQVLNQVSFEVPEGHVCTLLGASGSGKTTTLRLLAGLDRPDGGDIHIGGRHVAGRGVMVQAEQREVGMLFQSYALWPHMTVEDQIAYPLKLRKMSKEEMRSAIDTTAKRLGIERLLERYPSQLSGGQQQRVGLARALVFAPRLLLLDEPLSGLDAALRRQTLLELKKLQEQVKVTTVYVTHDQEEAMSVSDMVVVMSEGDVVSVASPRDTYERPQNVYVASFVGGSNALHGTLSDVSGRLATIRMSDGSRITGVMPKPVAVGHDAVAVIKPVDIGLQANQQVAEDTVSAQISYSTFLGPQVELMLDIAGQECRALTERGIAFERGDQVRVRLPRDLVTILPPE
jgi:iron(III) transport system ATP-binding protein